MAISQNFPDVRPSLNLNFARSKTLDPRITFERASIGTYVGADGLIKTAAADEPRFDHDPETGESLGLLIEESRTNKALRSENFENNPNYWRTQDGSNTSLSNITSPDGVSKMWLIDLSSQSGTSSNGSRVYQVGIAFGGAVNTFSFYARSVSGTGTFPVAYYNGSDYIKSYVTLTEETQRHSISLPTTGGNIVGFTRRGTTHDETLTQAYVWGAQVEEGSFPTSYIPTSDSTVTRQPDLAYITQANMQSWYNNTQGTIFSHSIGYRGAGGIAYFGSNAEGWGVYQNPSSRLRNKGRGSYTPDLASDNTILYNTYKNVRAGISINDTTNLSNYAVNGVIRGDSQTRSGPFTYPTGFGLAQTDVFSASHVTHSLCLNRIVYYPVSLSASQIQYLTQ